MGETYATELMRAVINIALEKTMKLVVFNLWVEMQPKERELIVR